jgi:hypothetical protein
MMELLGLTLLEIYLNTARYALAGAGTQTAALAFGGADPVGPPVTIATEEYDGTTWTTIWKSLNTARPFSRSWNSNSSFSFWWTPPGTHLIQQQQKNIMEHLGQVLEFFKYSKKNLAGCGTQTAALAFGG